MSLKEPSTQWAEIEWLLLKKISEIVSFFRKILAIKFRMIWYFEANQLDIIRQAF